MARGLALAVALVAVGCGDRDGFAPGAAAAGDGLGADGGALGDGRLGRAAAGYLDARFFGGRGLVDGGQAVDLSCDGSFGRQEACGGPLAAGSVWELVGACLEADALVARARRLCPDLTVSAPRLKAASGSLTVSLAEEMRLRYAYSTTLTATIELPSGCEALSELGGCGATVAWALELAMHQTAPGLPARVVCGGGENRDDAAICACTVLATWRSHSVGEVPAAIDADRGLLTLDPDGAVEKTHDYCVRGEVLRHRRREHAGVSLSYVLRRE